MNNNIHAASRQFVFSKSLLISMGNMWYNWKKVGGDKNETKKNRKTFLF